MNAHTGTEERGTEEGRRNRLFAKKLRGFRVMLHGFLPYRRFFLQVFFFFFLLLFRYHADFQRFFPFEIQTEKYWNVARASEYID